MEGGIQTNRGEGTPAPLSQFSPEPCTTEEQAARATASQIAKQLEQQPQPIILGSPITPRCQTPELEHQNIPRQTPTDPSPDVEMDDNEAPRTNADLPHITLPQTPVISNQRILNLKTLGRPAQAVQPLDTRKRTINLIETEPISFRGVQAKRKRFIPEFKNSIDYLEAGLDCFLKAADKEDDRKKHQDILDLVNIIREYTESGLLGRSKSILATQLRSLENSTRAVANRARELSKAQPSIPIPNPTPSLHAPQASQQTRQQASQPTAGPTGQSYATVATVGQEKWTTVPSKATAKKTAAKSKPKETRTAIFRPRNPIPEMSSLHMRNAFNGAFKEKHPTRGPILSSVTVSPRGNLVLTVTDGLTAKFLVENKAVIDSVTPTASVVENRSWYKVAVHGVPTADVLTLSREDFADIVKEEIKTFNKGLSPIGTPYWLSPEENRNQRRAGSIALAFETEAEARTAISKRLSIFGTSCKAEKLKGPRKDLPPRK